MAKIKKVKSFTMDEGPYEALFSMFKANYVDVSLSYCLNKYIKELLRYLEAIQGEMSRTGQYTMPMSFVIETVARKPIFQVPEDKLSAGSEESPLMAEVKDLQREYDRYNKKGGAEVDEAQSRELDTMTAMLKFAKVVAKVTAREITGHKLTDDEYIEMFRKEGGKPLQKAVRERLAPAMGFGPTGSKGNSRAKAKKDTEE
jgi:hypothetical protein